MTVVAQISIEGEQANFSQVLTGFNEDNLIVERETGFPSTDTQTLEVRTSEKEALLRFYDACVEHDIRLDLYRIYHKSDSADELAAAEESED